MSDIIEASPDKVKAHEIANMQMAGKVILRLRVHNTAPAPNRPAPRMEAKPASGHKPHRPTSTFQSAPPIQLRRATTVNITTTTSDRTANGSRRYKRNSNPHIPNIDSGILNALETSRVVQSCQPIQNSKMSRARCKSNGRILLNDIEPQLRGLTPIYTQTCSNSLCFEIEELGILRQCAFNHLNPSSPFRLI